MHSTRSFALRKFFEPVDKLIHKDSKVVGINPNPLTEVSERRLLSKQKNILDNNLDLLRNLLDGCRSTTE